MTASYRHLSELPCGLVSSDNEEEDSVGILALLSLVLQLLSLVLSDSYEEACRDRVVFQSVREL